MKFRAIIFDFNGLIVDDEHIHCECFQKVLAEEEITLTEKDYWDIYLGFDDKGLIEAIFERNGKKPTPKKLKDLIRKKADLYLPILEKKLKFFPGVLDFIQKTRGKCLLAVVSGALRSEIDFALKKAEIADAFATIVSAEETKHGKPDPQGYLLALARLKQKNAEIRPENCLALEDSRAGIEAAHRARMKCAGLTHSYPREKLKEADWVVESFDELSQIILKGEFP
ncbi:MAG: HAD family phosphatase [Deltaproteobacteria bacterium]|nr:HAD family phosphatase [Deltaproteobacteria bacterium]